MTAFLWLSSLYMLGRLPINSGPKFKTAIASIGILALEGFLLALFDAPGWAKIVFGLTLCVGQTGFVLIACWLTGKSLIITMVRLATLGLGLIVIAWLSLHVNIHPAYDRIAPAYQWLAQPPRLQHWGEAFTSRKFAATCFAVLLNLREAGNLVAFILYAFKVNVPDSNAFHHSGMIGSVERLLVLIFTRFYQFNAVAFVLTAKTVVRFHETRDEQATEYLLLGTLVSTLIAILIGLSVSCLCWE